MRGSPCLHMYVCGWLCYVSANGKVAHLRTYLLSKMKLYGACLRFTTRGVQSVHIIALDKVALCFSGICKYFL